MVQKTSVKVKKHAIKKSSQKKAKESVSEEIEIPLTRIYIAVGIIIIALIGFFGLRYFRTDKTGSEIAAVVNGEEISWAEIEEMHSSLPTELQAYITEEVLLNQTINELLLKSEAANKGIEADEQDLNSLVGRVTSQFSEEELEQTLLAQGLTFEEFREQLADRLRMNALLATEIPELRVNDTEVVEYFEQNKAQLGSPEQVRASHILVNTSDEAEEILRLLDEGADFSELAVERSTDAGSASRGGDLGYFSQGLMVPEFEDAAFALNVGEVSDVVQSDFGYHIIMLTDRKEAEEADFDELRSLIKFNLFDLKLTQNQDKFNEYVKRLWDKAELEVFEK